MRKKCAWSLGIEKNAHNMRAEKKDLKSCDIKNFLDIQ